ncbi:hypothetical protein [Pontibacter mangrovi]|uniref:Uncharacterized protein n=1 Tax=Pontibacter mangrovi TaxID=2589816 RepID=A0A501W6P8_9BACT|nr:hypothetical protein [Pontibacter mangrovi]TPE42961.1 hypothetical protein FJM65_15025 [Pontibacter mangrovi]
MRRIFLLMLLCSCATQRGAEEQNGANPPVPAQVKAATGYPAIRFYPPAVYSSGPALAGKLVPDPLTVRSWVLPPAVAAASQAQTVLNRIVYLPDTVQVDSLTRELKTEQLANQAIRERLQQAEADRDYWREMNRKKRWALIAMAVFAVLYILFKILAGRVRDTEPQE